MYGGWKILCNFRQSCLILFALQAELSITSHMVAFHGRTGWIFNAWHFRLSFNEYLKIVLFSRIAHSSYLRLAALITLNSPHHSYRLLIITFEVLDQYPLFIFVNRRVSIWKPNRFKLKVINIHDQFNCFRGGQLLLWLSLSCLVTCDLSRLLFSDWLFGFCFDTWLTCVCLLWPFQSWWICILAVAWMKFSLPCDHVTDCFLVLMFSWWTVGTSFEFLVVSLPQHCRQSLAVSLSSLNKWNSIFQCLLKAAKVELVCKA